MIRSIVLMLAQAAPDAAAAAMPDDKVLDDKVLVDKVLGLGVLTAGFVVGAILVLVATRFVRTVHLALGFATTACMWAIGYIAMMAPGLWLGELLFVATLAVPVAFGAMARRAGASPVKVGLTSAFANLLIIGAFLRDEKGGAPAWAPVAYVVGLFAASAVLAWIGGALARNARPIALPATAGLFARVSAGTIFILLVTGGLVTGLESGLAVPDWPNSFGHNMLLYPMSEMKGGIFYEHAHRLFGMLVGTTALVLVGVVWREDGRTWVRMIATAFLAMICVQGLLGGLRVTGNLTVATSGLELQPSTLLAIAHGMFGQIVFATACVIAVVTSGLWRNATPTRGIVHADRVRTLPFVLCALLLAQLFFGASYRHLQIPPNGEQAAVHPAWPIWAHIGGALVILVVAVITGAIASSRCSHIKPIRVLGKGLVHAVGLQLALGIGALVVVLIRVDEVIPAYEVIVTSAHQVLGALILAMTAMLGAFAVRMVAPEREPAAEARAAVTPSSSAA
jgi:cytochrome c oxidase assembly protein subunit 15